MSQSCSGLFDATQLASYLRARAQQRTGMYAVRLELLRNRWVNRQPWPAAVLREPLWAVGEGTDSGVYTISDADLVLLCNNLSVDRVDAAINRIVRLVGDDSPAHANPRNIRVTWFDLIRNSDFDALLAAAEASAHAGTHRHLSQTLRPITVADLPTIVERTRRLPLARMIRRQSALRMDPAPSPSLLFQEFYVSIGEFQRAFARGIDTVAHPALFGYLSERFDREVLAFLVAHESADLTRQGFSININMATMLSADYRRFEEVFANRNDVFLEFQLTDILGDFETYRQIRDHVKQMGFRVIVDGVTFSTLSHFDLPGLGADFIKLLCPETGRFEPTDPTIEEQIRRLGCDRLICARLENEELMKWALGLGVTRFQGLFIDKLIAALSAKGMLQLAAST